jgi:hypothetical protein
MRGLVLLALFLFVTPHTTFAETQSSNVQALKERVAKLEAENLNLRQKLWEEGITVSSAEDQDLPVKKSKAKKKPYAKSGFIDLNYQYDTRDFMNLTVNSGALLPHDFTYYQLLTLKSGRNSNIHERFDFTEFFTEVNFRHPILPEDPWLQGVDWTFQYVDGTFVADLIRLGARVHFHKLPGVLGDFFSKTLQMRFSTDFHFYETDGEGWQIEYVYNKQFMDGLFYLKGFFDQNMDPDGLFIIQEHQLGWNLFDNFYAIAELRYKTNNPRRDKWGVGLGGEYIIRF